MLRFGGFGAAACANEFPAPDGQPARFTGRFTFEDKFLAAKVAALAAGRVAAAILGRYFPGLVVGCVGVEDKLSQILDLIHIIRYRRCTHVNSR